MGEQSIRDLLDAGGGVLGNTVVLSGDYDESFPGSAHTLDSAGFATSLLLSGEISYAEYGIVSAGLATIAPHEFADDVMLVPGISYSVNGAIVEVRPNGLIVNGVHVNLTQTFKIDPVTGQVDVLDSSRNILGTECFHPDTPISMADGTKKPIRDIRVGDLVTSYDQDGNLVAGRV